MAAADTASEAPGVLRQLDFRTASQMVAAETGAPAVAPELCGVTLRFRGLERTERTAAAVGTALECRDLVA